MKNFLKSILLVSLSIFFFGMQVNAEVSTIDDLAVEIDKLQTLVETDFGSFYNKSEVIGIAASNFNMAASDYRLANRRILDSLNKTTEMLQELEASDEYSDSEKTRLQTELLQKANQDLNSIYKDTTDFIRNIRYNMGSITYDKFKTEFIDYYNTIGLNGTYIEY